VVLSKDEVAAILKTITNLKHKALIMTIYSGGLCISEVINLKPTCIAYTNTNEYNMSDMWVPSDL